MIWPFRHSILSGKKLWSIVGRRPSIQLGEKLSETESKEWDWFTKKILMVFLLKDRQKLDFYIYSIIFIGMNQVIIKMNDKGTGGGLDVIIIKLKKKI